LADPARLAAYRLLRGVAEKQAYANLLLPALLAEGRLSSRDAALATELGYGTVRAQGTLDVILAACVDRSLSTVDAPVLDLLRLGAYQAVRTRVPRHAAVATTVDLARETGHARAAGFVNAVLRRVAEADWDEWTRRLGAGASPLRRLSLSTAHPEWIVAAFADALGDDMIETEGALVADDARPQTHLVAWPGRIKRDALVAESGGTPGPWSSYAVRLDGGDPAALPSIREGRAGVQDEGSQLCALALVAAPLSGPDARWLDMCAGPGGKTALLAAIAASRGVAIVANELHPHRAELVRRVTAPWDVEVVVGDARELTGSFDRILLDAPCTGLGALRRRPEARWRRDPSHVPALAALQRELLAAALRVLRPGGVIAYVTCSPHLAETRDVVAGAALLDARPAFPDVPQLGDGPTVQLWPHRHGTDAMFCALLRG
jgi:16S rRNA (cytosine967-C5)-methyltransferase